MLPGSPGEVNRGPGETSPGRSPVAYDTALPEVTVPDLTTLVLLAQDAAMDGGGAGDGGSGGGGSSNFLLMLGVMFLIFYVLMIRPQSKERRKREEMIKALGKGDKVVTTAGIHGEVVATDDRTVTLEVADGVRMKFDRTAVWQVTPKDAPKPEAAAAPDAKADPKADPKAKAR